MAYGADQGEFIRALFATSGKRDRKKNKPSERVEGHKAKTINLKTLCRGKMQN